MDIEAENLLEELMLATNFSKKGRLSLQTTYLVKDFRIRGCKIV